MLANDQEIARTEVVRSSGSPVDLDVPIPQADVLRLSLRTIPAEAAPPDQNLAVWGEPMLHLPLSDDDEP